MTILRFTEFEWFILESSQNLTANSQVDSRNVAQGNIKNVSDDLKQRLIANRKPRKGFEFPAREYMDHCRSDGKMNHYCNPEWFDTYKFLAYSGQEVGVYCLSCILFLTQPKNGSRTAKLIITPYTDWRKATDYLFSHVDDVSIIRRLSIGLTQFFIHRTIHQFVLINEWQIMLPTHWKKQTNSEVDFRCTRVLRAPGFGFMRAQRWRSCVRERCHQ